MLHTENGSKQLSSLGEEAVSLVENPVEVLQIAQAMAGSKDAFAILYQRYYSSLMYLVYSYVQDVQTAEDLTQESFTKALVAISSYQEKGAFRGWLYQIARREAFNYLKRVEKRRSPLDITSALDRMAQFAQPDQVAKRLLQQELMQIIEWAIEALPESQREVVRLKLANEGVPDKKPLTNEAIAVQLDITVAAVKSRYYRAVRALQQLLGPYLA